VENNVRPRRWQWLWPLAIALLVIAASHRPRLASTQVANGDKVVHFAVYGLLATLVARLGVGWRGALVGLAVASAFGVTDEFHQSFVPHRSSDAMDWVADTLGAALAVTLYAGWPWYRRCLEYNLRQRRIENAAPTPTIAGR
jgi:VanZ family protein